MRQLEVITKRIDEIKPNQENAKMHTDEQIIQIKSSITEFGFKDPIAIDEDNEIIEGHGRYIAAQELGMQEVPCMILEGLTTQEKAAYGLIHNKLTMDTGFEYDALMKELEDIKGIDMTEFGFADNMEYFGGDENVYDNLKKTKYIVITDQNQADDIRNYLNSNGIKFKEVA